MATEKEALDVPFNPPQASSPKGGQDSRIETLEKKKKRYEEELKMVTAELYELSKQLESTHLDDSEKNTSTFQFDASVNELKDSSTFQDSASEESRQADTSGNESFCEIAKAEISKGASLPHLYYVIQCLLKENLGGQNRTTVLMCYDKPGTKKLIFENVSGKKKQHAEIGMLIHCKKEDYLPNKIWLSRTPCCDCAKELKEAYEARKQDPPTIYVTSLYNGKGGSIVIKKNKHIEQVISLMKNKFTFGWWKVEDDLVEFQSEITTYTTQLSEDKKYLEQKEEVKALLEKCKKFSKIIDKTSFDNWDDLEKIYKFTYEDIAHIVPLEVQGRTVILTMFKERRGNIEPIILNTEDVEKVASAIRKNVKDNVWQEEHWNGVERNLVIGCTVSRCPKSEFASTVICLDPSWDNDVLPINKDFIDRFHARIGTPSTREELQEQVLIIWENLSWIESDKKFDF